MLAVYIGTHLGKKLLGYIPERIFKKIFKISLTVIAIKLIFDAYLYRACWNGYDDFTYSYFHVWFYTRECSKGFVFLLFRYMDGYMYCIRLRIID